MSSKPVVGPVESVWDYPRPPRLEPTPRRLRIVHAGIVLAETTRALRILETSHPPVFYLPQSDILMQFLRPSPRRGSFCEFKGVATYWNIDLTGAHLPDGRLAPPAPVVPAAAWSYPDPSHSYLPLQRPPRLLCEQGRRVQRRRRACFGAAGRLLRWMDYLACERPVQRLAGHDGLVSLPEREQP